jgi:hypothetical protein
VVVATITLTSSSSRVQCDNYYCTTKLGHQAKQTGSLFQIRSSKRSALLTENDEVELATAAFEDDEVNDVNEALTSRHKQRSRQTVRGRGEAEAEAATIFSRQGKAMRLFLEATDSFL